jgi:hypothetical protein
MEKNPGFVARLRQAARRAAVPATGAALWKALRATARRNKIPCPVRESQTPYNWLSGTMPDAVEMLFLSEVLNTSAIWLATGQGTPNRGFRPTDGEKEALEIYRTLNEDVRNAWVQLGHDLLPLTGKAKTRRTSKRQVPGDRR